MMGSGIDAEWYQEFSCCSRRYGVRDYGVLWLSYYTYMELQLLFAISLRRLRPSKLHVTMSRPGPLDTVNTFDNQFGPEWTRLVFARIF